ncbi:MAG: VTT domain-containing protein [Nitrosopumilus sp.]|nr:VTT domain-containing protein [Nitrosopumilus sp.]MDC4229876.1 VTT domain-containing protein [Nitrosopumilus sp.]
MSYELFMEYYLQAQEILANNTFQEYGIIGLFLNSLLAATALPLPTEILTSALLIGGESVFLVAIALIAGSVIGGILNYTIGFGGSKLLKKIGRKSNTEEPVKKHVEKQEKKHHKLLNRFGWGAIFFAAWIPVVGDLMLITAGVKKMKFRKFLIVMISGKIVKTSIVVLGLGTLF